MYCIDCPWPKQGTKRMRTRSPQDDEAAQAVKGDARITAITVMHVLSDTVMPNPFLNITRNRETTLEPISGQSLSLTTVTASGCTALIDPSYKCIILYFLLFFTGTSLL